MRRQRNTQISPGLTVADDNGRPDPPRKRGPDYTTEILAYLRTAHGKTRVDAAGDHYYDGVSAVSIHFFLNSGLPAKEVLWQWYLHFDRERSEPIYQTLPPQRDEELLQILERCDFFWESQAVRESGLVFLDHHRSLIYIMLEDFLSARVEAYRTMTDDELRDALTPRETWSERHLAKLIHDIQVQPLTSGQRHSVYDQFDSGYLKATARHIIDQVATDGFWKNPAPELEEFGANLIGLVRFLTSESRRLGVHVSHTAYERESGKIGWDGTFGGSFNDGQSRPKNASRYVTKEAHFATLGLHPKSSLNDVKSAYREMVKQHHPDQGGTVQDFLRLQEAYEFILTEVF